MRVQPRAASEAPWLPCCLLPCKAPTMHKTGQLQAKPSQAKPTQPHQPAPHSPDAALILELVEPLQLAQSALRPLDAAAAAAAAIAAAIASAAAAVLLAAGCRTAARAAAAAHLIKELSCLRK